MKVSVRLFAGLRERAGRDELVLDLPEGARVADALAAVQHLAPGTSLVLAVNREYADPDVELAPGDELAVVPPVSGGAVVDGPLSLDAVAERVRDPRAGAIVTFSGTTRDVAFLDYEAYAEMAAERIDAIVAEAIERHGLCRAAADHRYGRVALGEASVVVAASAPHRPEAFAGAREIIDRIKAEAPIWKREEGAWAEGAVPGAPETPDAPADPEAERPLGGRVLDVAIDARLEHGGHVLVVHGVAEAEARVGWLGGRFHQLRCVEALDPAPVRGDVVEVRRLGDDELLGEATVLDGAARRHGPTNDALVRLVALERGEEPRDDAAIAPPPLDAEALALERRYAEAGTRPPHDVDLTPDERAALFALREAGRVVLLERGRHVHVDFAA
ncbi:MAG TPA: molybdenum cofactor biosynthesis protein MoaE [Baekduia sp.]|uniref:molybdenum cofactor biosynthesis protein n=1 Tax=Baekduia sp. TaxID=2600305 RepID=UPI002D79EC8B|nr:molybdenum cofactor biosynthesis protein MoaE [Baekduia sp.]HET6509450.1 molybdenum cofactor biosynthesis protein MoaE [Baekduia sp.]